MPRTICQKPNGEVVKAQFVTLLMQVKFLEIGTFSVAGFGTGSLVGGSVYEVFGGVILFRACASTAAGVLVIFFTLETFILIPRAKKKAKNMANGKERTGKTYSTNIDFYVKKNLYSSGSNMIDKNHDSA